MIHAVSFTIDKQLFLHLYLIIKTALYCSELYYGRQPGMTEEIHIKLVLYNLVGLNFDCCQNVTLNWVYLLIYCIG